MQEIKLKYGCNPNQGNARIFVEDDDMPVDVLNGNPGYINFLDAFNGYQLVRELKKATGIAAAASFKHTSPTSAAVGIILSEELKKACFAENIEGLDSSPIACAYVRARGADRMSSFGDFAALSDTCDKAAALVIKNEVSDGIIAPDFTDEALDILKSKKKGDYNIIKIDKNYIPDKKEIKQVFGIYFEQERNNITIDDDCLEEIVSRNKSISLEAKRDMLISLITLKYTQSNSVCLACNGQAIGVGAGQQSRIHCTRLACDKADKWHLRQSERALSLPFKPELNRAARDNIIDIYLSPYFKEGMGKMWREYFTEAPEAFSEEEKADYLSRISGVSLGSDGFFPFPDNIERARKSGVDYIVEPGGSVRDNDIIRACDKYNMTLSFTGIRLFHH